MAEGTKNLATDAQRVAEVKPDHKIMALDPETGMMVFIEPSQLPNMVIDIPEPEPQIQYTPAFSNSSDFEI